MDGEVHHYWEDHCQVVPNRQPGLPAVLNDPEDRRDPRSNQDPLDAVSVATAYRQGRHGILGQFVG